MPELYELMRDYPLRPAKGLRPTLCVATCRALGGLDSAPLPSAVALELYHNAFLIHDDVEDDSEVRRKGPTLHHLHGVPVAVNVGDGMLALALEPLLANTEVVGLARTLRILRVFSQTCRETAEGQMLELGWIRRGEWALSDRDYLRMVALKTASYTFIAPVVVGAIAARADQYTIDRLARFALLLGIAFQISDDLLSLEGDASVVGKDAYGDLWEGKRTLVLLHTLRSLDEPTRQELLARLEKPRAAGSREVQTRKQALLDGLDARLTGAERSELEGLLGLGGCFDETDLKEVLAAIEATGGREHARGVAQRFASRSRQALELALGPSDGDPARAFLEHLVDYVLERGR